MKNSGVYLTRNEKICEICEIYEDISASREDAVCHLSLRGDHLASDTLSPSYAHLK